MDIHNFQIKKSDSIHHPALLALWEKAIQRSDSQLDDIQIEQVKELISQHHYFDFVNLLHVEQDNKIIGFISYAYHKIEMLFVDPDYENRGVGKALLNHVIDLGVDEVEVSEQNSRAIAFYQHLGFVVTARSELDAEGNPFPIVFLKITRPEVKIIVA